MSVKTFQEAFEVLKPHASYFYMSIMLAQWALESTRGTSDLAVNANNFTGHKYYESEWPSHKVYRKNTLEWSKDKNAYITVYDAFRKYDSPSEWAEHHTKWMERLPGTYAKAIRATTLEEQARALTGTYATDPKYATKLLKYIKDNNLERYDELYTNKKYVNGHRKDSGNMVKLRTPKEMITKVNTFGRHTNKPKFIVIHFVGAKGQAHDNAKYFRDKNRDSSAHIFIDKNETYRVGYDDMAMWHIGDGNYSKVGAYNGYVRPGMATNYNTLSIEMCQTVIPGKSVWNWPIDEIVIQQTLLQTKEWMEKYHIPIENVIRHYDASGKNCPGCWNDNGKWTKWWEFKARLQKLLDSGELVSSGKAGSYNPQGLEVSTPLGYREPRLPFDALKTGQTVTLLDDKNEAGQYIWQWYDPENKKLLKSKRQSELAGTTDKIVEVKEIEPIQHSKFLYKLEKYNSWILEEYLEEARDSWKLVDNNAPIQNGFDDKTGNYVFFNGKKYTIGDEIKE